MKIINIPYYKCPHCGTVFTFEKGAHISKERSLEIYHMMISRGELSEKDIPEPVVDCPVCKFVVVLKNNQYTYER